MTMLNWAMFIAIILLVILAGGLADLALYHRHMARRLEKQSWNLKRAMRSRGFTASETEAIWKGVK